MLARPLAPTEQPTESTLTIPKLLQRFMQRIMGLQPGRAYALTLWMPEDTSSEPVWSVKDLGKIENQR